MSDEPLLSGVSSSPKLEEGKKKVVPPLPPWDSSKDRRPASGTPKKSSTKEEEEEEDFPVKKEKRSIILNVCLFILITEFCERLAYYGLSGSLIAFFVKKLDFDKVTASELNTLFTTLCYLTPLFGAYISDKYLGRYKTILGGSIIYAIGLFLCTYGAVPPNYEAGYFLPGLFLFVTIGSGCIKPCVVTLGADQFDPKDPEQVLEKAKFFNYFYWAINLGATLSYGYLTHLALNGQAPYVIFFFLVSSLKNDFDYFVFHIYNS
jgi:solute carrier family 15 (peptide/histidine transporter), member 3/4